MDKLSTAIDLSQQILELAIQQDKEFKAYWMKKQKWNKTVGESSLCFHVRTLQELLKEIKDDKDNEFYPGRN